MDSGSRGEAERWLYTANKLLSARDLHGARSFAIRARECDPRFEATELLLAVIDTLMAGEARISDHLVDWYAVLQVIRYTHNIDYIAAQYRRLAVLLDPHRNPFAFAAHAFSLLHDAWSVLSNPNKKALFDNDLRVLTEPPPPPPPQPAPVAPVPILPQAFPILQQQQMHDHQNHQNQNLHHHHHHHQNRHQQQQQPPPQLQEQELLSARKSPRSREVTSIVVAEEEEAPIQDNVTEPTQPAAPPAPAPTPTPAPAGENGPVETEERSFWTACPYCYVMYEYPKVYEECTLLCQSCRRAFHAVAIRSPPSMSGKDGTFCSWGFLPLGFSGDFKDISGSSSKWNPFSQLFPCPLKGASSRRYPRGPFVYHDDEAAAAFVELSDTTESDSDDGDWRTVGSKNRRRKRVRRSRKRFSYAGSGGEARRPTVERPRRGVHSNSNGAAGNDNVDGAGAVDGDGEPVPVPVAVVRPEASKKAALGSSRRRGAGNLDLNVEFSNEVEEQAAHVAGGARHGNANGPGNAEDNIEGIGFFEGLDEFLSSLPILNVVADDKVKGH